MVELQANTFPPGMEYNFAYDVSRFLDASIQEVLVTLIEAFILVFIVVYVFLQDFRSTLIPALAVPVALIGTFAFMHILGFSINLLTLFALVLAIGIVVDNAIVVVEAVHARIQEKKQEPMMATIETMREISGAIISITLVMSAVFIPVAFLSGPVGVFYRQFSITLAIAIVISGINALTLTPALCALLLRQHSGEHTGVSGKFFSAFNRRYQKVENSYKGMLLRIVPRRAMTFGLMFLFFGLTWGFGYLLPGGFIPTEDQGMIYVNVNTPPGATMERTAKVLQEIEARISDVEGVENITTLAGYSLLNEVAGASYGMGMINLKAWDERSVDLQDCIRMLNERTRNIQDAEIEFFPPPTVPGFGNASGFEFRLLDRTGSPDLGRMALVSDSLIQALNASPVIGSAFTSFDPNFPQYLIHVDQAQAAMRGVDIDNALSTLQTLIGSYYATNFIRFGQMYKVMIQALPEYREKPDDILSLYVKNRAGEMVSYASFIRMERVFGPEQLTRYNMYNAAMITGDAAAGRSSGDALQEIERIANETLPKGYDYQWSGMTREQVISGDQAVYIFVLCLVFVYLLLAAQYESFLLPLPVILSLPAGIFGSFMFLYFTGLENNIYAQVALVMLIGLLGKNAILIVEFALQRQRDGVSVIRAVTQGAVSRLRPILMTSFAFISGLLPLCFASGAGAAGNQSIGISAAGGMLTGTLLGLLIIPGIYLIASLPGRRLRYVKMMREKKYKHLLTDISPN
jgi:hydrophobe/amphiphile efflux-1 (HAE1) family protein